MADLTITEADRKRLLHAYETLVLKVFSQAYRDESVLYRMACRDIKKILAGDYDGAVLDKTHPGLNEWGFTTQEVAEALK